ncbi:MAG TPA: VOC family protein [Mycobacteriales bacterium]|nr:VOC family protein [Mycobacteriales bacterium]
MSTRIGNIVIEAPDPTLLAEFYGELLGLPILQRPPDWLMIGREGRRPKLAFDGVPAGWRPPRWPDPAYPQQVHLDIGVPDRAAVEEWLPARGATRPEHPDPHIWVDPAGHPICLNERPGPPGIDMVVLDSGDHEALAAFYCELLGLEPTSRGPDWVGIGEGTETPLGFTTIDRHTRSTWPDPAYPQQMHLDIGTEDRAALARAEQLGATRLPAVGGGCPVYADPAGHPICLCLPGE